MICIVRYFMLILDLITDPGTSEGNTSHHDNGNIRVELEFKKALPEAITFLLYLEKDNCLRIDWPRTVTTDISIWTRCRLFVFCGTWDRFSAHFPPMSYHIPSRWVSSSSSMPILTQKNFRTGWPFIFDRAPRSPNVSILMDCPVYSSHPIIH